jgi:beta-aspartyl-peptidase (threonine type)
MQKYSLVIHGGAGLVFDHGKYKDSIQKILDTGDSMLKEGKLALDVVEYCVTMLENDPLYNAGYGSVLTSDGHIEMDAAIMDGRNLDNGAVAGIKNVKNLIKVARLVMEKKHVLLIGEGAQKFINENTEIEKCEEGALVTEQRVKQLEDAISKNEVRLDHSGTDEKEKKFGTVGAVAMDIKGNLAAATSTGGIVNKKYGRVGDTPIIGAGTIADNNSVAVSCTGFGEQFIKVSFAKRLADYVELLNMNAQEASEKTVEDLINKVNGLGGSISIDKNGNIGIAHSSPCILFGLSKDGYKMVGVSREDLQK